MGPSWKNIIYVNMGNQKKRKSLNEMYVTGTIFVWCCYFFPMCSVTPYDDSYSERISADVYGQKFIFTIVSAVLLVLSLPKLIDGILGILSTKKFCCDPFEETTFNCQGMVGVIFAVIGCVGPVVCAFFLSYGSRPPRTLSPSPSTMESK